MEYDSLSRCLGGEMVDTRDSKNLVKKKRGGSSPLQGIILKWNKFGSGSRNLGDLLYLMNGEGESALKSSALRPAVYDSTGITQGDFGTGWTLPKLVLSGRVNSIIDAWRHSSLPSPFRTYPKQNPVLLGREYLNRANHSVDIFTSEQNN
uniref:Uncharacterized protein n=1 Tax=Brassica campestris TaxID=3711 RepID=A0A3P6D5J8_BRACM|nr:unnamed protein product [Brassica rapa]